MPNYVLSVLIILLCAASYGFLIPAMISAHNSLICVGGVLVAFFTPLLIWRLIQRAARKGIKN